MTDVQPDPDFDDALRAYYTDARLPEARLEALMALAEVAPSRRPPRRALWLLAAAACCVIGLGTWWVLSKTIPEEIVANHRKATAPTVLTADYAALGGALPRLDFTPKASGRLSAYRLVGARYCSVDGHLAAQLQLRDAQGRRYTLYQADGRAVSATHPRRTIDGVVVETWQEAGLFMGFAGPPLPSP